MVAANKLPGQHYTKLPVIKIRISCTTTSLLEKMILMENTVLSCSLIVLIIRFSCGPIFHGRWGFPSDTIYATGATWRDLLKPVNGSQMKPSTLNPIRLKHSITF